MLTLAVTALGHEIFRLDEETAYLIALIITFGVNFLGARFYVYKSTYMPMGRQLGAFLLSSLGFRGLEYAAFLILHSLLGMYYLLASILIMTISFICKFLFYRSTIFKAE